MIPANYTLHLVENSNEVQTFVISGITNSTGYNVEIDIRDQDGPHGELLLGLSIGNGISVSASSSGLSITVGLTSIQRTELINSDSNRPFWSLKVTDPGGVSRQYLKGNISFTRTTTT